MSARRASNADGTAPDPVLSWPSPRLLALEVAQIYGFATTAAGFSYVGALLTLGVLVETGDVLRGAVWFLFASLVTFVRAFLVIAYRRRSAAWGMETWARLMVFANLLAGIQWGLLGTVLFPQGPLYAQLFTLMVIICFVAGSVTAYAALKGAHEALSVPATVPTALYLFFVHDGVHWYAGVAALFFCFAIVHYSGKLHRHMRRTFELQVERDDLLALTQALNEKLSTEKLELAHRAAVRGASMESARDQARRLSALFERSPLPQLECDGAGRIVGSNAAAQRFFARTREELSGSPLDSLVTARGAPIPEIAAGGTFEVEVKVRGDTVECSASITPLAADEGQRGGFGVALVGVSVPAST
jgi:PAS domain-containing protein